ncbi:portal protein [Neptuniibacter halophilus]|uniref:portal protein n=1 Tax=Neptuniibacter halophilus TaxID=651666 RepID=UPI002572469F|nr:hypothetical protein [Neptuniibacter halophilus]
MQSDEQKQTDSGENYWLQRARQIYSNSSDFLDADIRRQVEKNLAHFNNEHARDSKFNSPNYRNRNRLFHPKSRQGVTNNEAAFAAAMFSTADLVSVSAGDDGDPRQQASAEINQELLNYRLAHSIPWFLTSVGAYQAAQVYGIVASYNYWRYEEKAYVERVPLVDAYTRQPVLDDQGQPAYQEIEHAEVLHDKPCVDLIPFENLRFDPAADWRDPISTSPYVIREVPMFACDVLARMGSEDSKTGRQDWKNYTIEQLISASQEDNSNDATRKAREGEKRNDSTEVTDYGDYTIIWLRENFVRIQGEEFVYWTVGDMLLLSDPEPLEDVYLHGMRPITLGICNLEAFKNYPKSPVELASGLQERVNSVINQRADNVDLVLNKRYYIRRGAKIDTAALVRNTPGGGVMMDDIIKEIRTESTPDVTSSSYAEQDRLDVLMDEAAGAFSQASVQNNRALNETVGGMELMNGSASAVSEYRIRTFVETWVEPTLRQLVQLEQKYETDETIMALCARKAGMYQKYGENLPLDQLLEAELTVRVNVGIGATNPQQKLDRMITGFGALGQIAPNYLVRVKPEEVVNEIFGAVGYKDGQRFFMNEQEFAEFQEQNAPPPDPEFEIKRMELEQKGQKIAQEGQKLQFDMQFALQELNQIAQLKREELQYKRTDKAEDLQRKALIEERRIQTTRDIAAGRNLNDQTRIQLQAQNLSQGNDTF